MNKKALILLIFLITLLTVGVVFWRWENAKKTEIERQMAEQQHQEDSRRQDKERQAEAEKWNDIHKKFNARLDIAQEEILFSIPADAKIKSFCPDCEEKNIDLAEGQWEFSVSPNYKRYAYILSKKEDRYVILDGKKNKTYEDVYYLNFSPNNRDFSYHAYDGNWTYLVYNDKEIPVYPAREGFPQAANGVSEAFSIDGNHFAYARVEKNNPNLMHIILDNQEINTIEAESINMGFGDDGHLEYIVSVGSKNNMQGHNYDYLYYKNGKLISSNLNDYNTFFRRTNDVDNGYNSKIENKKILINGIEVASYDNHLPEVYISELLLDGTNHNLVYKIQTNERPGNDRISLNGNDSESAYNDIRNIRFSDDKKQVIYIGRKGRNVYKVVQEIIKR